MKDSQIKIALIGHGYWGRNLARNFHSNKNFEITHLVEQSNFAVCDFQELYGKEIKVCHLEDALKEVDAVVIATPPETHYELARKCLINGKHVFVEKPMAMRSEHCHELVELAGKRRLGLMVDHTYTHSAPINYLERMVRAGGIGKPLYYDSIRANLGIFQEKCGVLWDLAVHDLSIVDKVFNKPMIENVSCRSFSHYPKQRDNLAYLTLRYAGNFIVHLNVSWASPLKMRQALIAGDKAMVVYDDVEADSKIKIYDKGVDLVELKEPIAREADHAVQEHRNKVSYRQGSITIPFIGSYEPLQAAVSEFEFIIEKGINRGEEGLRVVRILEAAQSSAMDLGRTIEMR